MSNSPWRLLPVLAVVAVVVGGTGTPALAQVGFQANPHTYSVPWNHTLTGNVIADGGDDTTGATSVTNTSNPDHATPANGGSFSFTSETGVLDSNAGDFTYVPDTGFVGTDGFDYQLSDGVTTSSAHVTINVTNDPPVANNDGPYTMSAPGPMTVSAPGLLGNDTDANGDPLKAVHHSGAPNGHILSFPRDGSFEYRPNAGFCNGTDSFTYQAYDGNAYSNKATVTITVKTTRKSTSLSLFRPKRIVYGQAAHLTAHLSGWSASAIVRIYKKPYGGTRHLLARGRPDLQGNFKAVAHPSRLTWYYAKSTDNCYQWEKTGGRTVEVAPLVKGTMLREFAFRKGYALYHVNGKPPRYRATVTPDHTGWPVLFQWQRRVSGTWRAYFKQQFQLGTHSKINVYMTSGVAAHTKYRVRIVFKGDPDHLARAARWSYFRAV